MVIKMDKSEDFIKSGKKLISEYDGANLKEDEEQKPVAVWILISISFLLNP